MTPAQRQYMELKAQNKDSILLFRMWDFYEAFFQDAKIVSKELDIVLTYKDKKSENPTPMAWVPFHSVDKYLPKLVEKGYKVAIAEQIWPVVPWQLVKREVVNVLTPWTFLNETDNKYTYICAISSKESNDWNYHIAYWDFSIWNYFTKSFKEFDEFLKYITKLNPSEVVIDIDFLNKQELKEYIKAYLGTIVNIHDIPYDVKTFLKNNLKVEKIEWYWKALDSWRAESFALLINYLLTMQKQSLKNISQISYISDENKVKLDENTIRNLEVFKSSYEWQKKHSLFAVINNCKSWMGNRKMIDIISNPINDINKINTRLKHIQYYIQNTELREKIIDDIKELNDIPKIISTLLYKKNSPVLREKLKNSLSIVFKWDSKNYFIENILKIDPEENDIEKIFEFSEKLNLAIKEQSNEYDYIQEWFSDEIDKIREFANNSSKLILEYQQEVCNHTKLNLVKIKYIKNQWYFIETSKKDSKQLENNANSENEKFDFVRAQTLKNQERYTTTYLQNLQEKIDKSKDELNKLQKQVLDNLLEELLSLSKWINKLSDNIWFLDLFTNFSKFAEENDWTMPTLTQTWETEIINWRHPVIEKYLPSNENFVPNDLKINNTNSMQIITGPNMWWKSTFLRQNAIIILLAHCWLYIPCQSWKIATVDWIYARVWSWDIIAKNQSTFLTEMIEVANILNNSTKDSFIILDELWRWTSTYDWVAIAKAITQFLAEKTKAKTLFATHYHELIKLEEKYKNIKNYSVSVYETDKQVVFLKKISEWWANKSYGIDVAKIAGLPKEILDNARHNLQELESKSISIKQNTLFEEKEINKKDEKIKEELDNIDINNITPMQALDILNKLKKL